MSVTESRKQAFLKVLRETGSFRAACRAASPHATGEHAGSSTWHDLMRHDPEFAAAVEQAKDDFVAMAEQELVRRSFEVPTRPVLNRAGEVVGQIEDRMSADRMLMNLIRRHAPEYRETKALEVSGQIEHRAHLMLKPVDILLLDEPDRVRLIELLEQIQDRRNGRRVEVPALEVPQDPRHAERFVGDSIRDDFHVERKEPDE
jgi:hypothetical protein